MWARDDTRCVARKICVCVCVRACGTPSLSFFGGLSADAPVRASRVPHPASCIQCSALSFLRFFLHDVTQARFFANKLWNAGRFLLGNLKGLSSEGREALAVSGPMTAQEVRNM